MSIKMLKPPVSMYSLHFKTMNTIICLCKDIIKVNYKTIKTNDPREEVLNLFFAMKSHSQIFNKTI